ncbi:unnamed protein product [Phaeothamnion confervicola]
MVGEHATSVAGCRRLRLRNVRRRRRRGGESSQRRHAGFLAQMTAETEEGSNGVSHETDAAAASGRFELVAADEVRAFQRAPWLSMQDNTAEWNDQLLWWHHHLEFPNIAKLAPRVLCVSAPSKRLFSFAGLTVTQRQSRLTDHSVVTLICLEECLPVVEAWHEKERAQARPV